MQLRLTLRGRDIRLPLAYGQAVQGFLYHAGRTADGHSAFLHDEGYRADGRSYRLFTFGPLSGAYTIVGREIRFRDTVKLEVRSADDRFLLSLFETLRPESGQRLGENPVTVLECTLENRRILESRCTVRTLAPITVYRSTEDGHTRYFPPEDPRFARGVVQNARRKWKSCHDSVPPEFSFHVPEGESYRKTVTSYKGVYITGWSGEFLMEGESAMLDFLFQTGLGAKNAQGFGMFRTIK